LREVTEHFDAHRVNTINLRYYKKICRYKNTYNSNGYIKTDGMKFNKQDIAEEFNKYFATVAEKVKKRQISKNYITVNGSNMW
jgi:hypothetical protein